MAYTNVPAPTSPSYTKVDPGGLIVMDDATIEFDSSLIQFDGNTATYTKVATPTTPSYTDAPAPTNP